MFVIPLGFMVVQLGMICASRRVTMELDKHQVNDLLRRHMIGDWGDIDGDGWERNEKALAHDSKVISSYLVGDVRRCLVITEADRSETTILLAEEYGAKN